MPKTRNSNTIGTMGLSGGSGSGAIEDVEMSQRLENRLQEARTVDVDIESRTRGRMETAQVTFDPQNPGRASVLSESGQTYDVDYENDTCNCSNYIHRGNGCRHIDATHMAMGQVLGRTPIADERPGSSDINIDRAIQTQQELDRREEESRRALTGEVVDDGFFYSDNREEFESDIERLRNEQLPYDYENALNGSGVTFGLELEFVDGNSDAIARELYDLGICGSPQMIRYHGHSQAGKWKLEYDGTVSNRSTRRGGELVSPVLQDTPQTWQQLEKICEVAKRHGARINSRCGGHVHIGMEPLDTARQRWRRFFKSVKGHEEVMYRFSGGTEGRVRSGHSDYAQPFFSTAQRGSTARYTIEDEQDVRNMIYTIGCTSDYDRYYGINLTNIREMNRPNTVEFRYFNGSLSPAQIQANVKLAAGMVNTSEQCRTRPSRDGEFEVTENQIRRGKMISEASNGRDKEGMIKFLDTYFSRKRDKEHILGVLAKNDWR